MANNLEVVVRVRDLTTQGIARITQSISRMGASVLRWTGALTGLGGTLSAGGIIAGIAKFGSELEDLEGRLAAVFEGDLKLAAVQLERIRALASEPIVGTDQLVDAFIKGATTIRGFSEETLSVLSDVAITFDRDVGSVMNAWAAGTSKSLQQMGIVLDRTGKEWTVNGERVERSMDAVREKIIQVWEREFPNAVDRAATRFSGATAIFQDALEDLLGDIGRRILPKITVELNKLTQWVEDHDDEIIEFADKAATGAIEWANGIDELARSLKEHETEWRILRDVVGLFLLWKGGFKGKAIGAALVAPEVFAGLDAFQRQVERHKQAMADLRGERRDWDAGEFVGPLPNWNTTAPFGVSDLGIDIPLRWKTPPPGPSPEGKDDKSFTGVLLQDLDDLEIKLDDFIAKSKAAREAWLAKDVTDFGDSFTRAFDSARESVRLTNEDVQDFADSTIADIKTAFTDDFAKGLADMMNGVTSFEESWKGAVTAVLEGLQQIILKMLLMAAYQKFLAPVLEGIFGAGVVGAVLGKSTAGALVAPASFRGAAQTIVIQPQVQFNASFVDPSGAAEFFARNRETLAEIATGAVVKAIDRVPSFRARVKG